MKLGDPAAQVAVETVPTGSLSLDIALGMGGVPKDELWKSMDRNPVVRQRLHCT